jgi:hypothetical protein
MVAAADGGSDYMPRMLAAYAADSHAVLLIVARNEASDAVDGISEWATECLDMSHSLIPRACSSNRPTAPFVCSSLAAVGADLRGDMVFLFGLRVRTSSRGAGLGKLLMVRKSVSRERVCAFLRHCRTHDEAAHHTLQHTE